MQSSLLCPTWLATLALSVMLGVSGSMRGVSAQPTTPETRFFVSPDGSDTWSGALPAANAARTDGPFATLHRARDAVRALCARGLDKPVRVIVGKGAYYLPSTLLLGPEDSGTERCRITYEARQGEKVVLSGGRPITGWQTEDGKLYYADLPQARGGKWPFRQLFVDGRREMQARYPNYDPTDVLRKGWLYATSPADTCIILAGLANHGDWMEYRFSVPAEGTYALWVGYATTEKSITKTIALKIDGTPVPLPDLPASGGWRKVRYRQVARLDLRAGEHVLRWESWAEPELELGRRIHFDAFVFTDKLDCPTEDRPAITGFPTPQQGERRVVVQAESKEARTGGKSSIDGGFQAFDCSRKLASPRVIHCAKGTIRPHWAKAPGAEVHIFAMYGWYNQIVGLAGVDVDKSTIAIDGNECQGKIWPGNRFFVSNVFEELDQPGEWYLGAQAGRLYYWPRDGSPERAAVVAPVLDRVIELRADVATKSRVEYVTFRGFTFAHTDYTVGHVEMRTAQDGCIKLECASHCAVENCTFTNIGGYAIWLHLDSCHNRLVGNTITQAGAGGALLTSAWIGWGKLFDSRKAAARFAPIHNTISNNHIHHCGAIRKYVSGIHIDHRPKALAAAPGNVVAHNHIHHMPRLGIFAFAHQGGSVLEHNHIHDVMLESDDGGGIHINTAQNDFTAVTHIRNNLIHDVLGPKVGADGTDHRALGFGIYLDGATSNCVLANNIVYRTSMGAVFVNGGKNNVVENNVLVDDVVQQIWINNYRGDMSGNRFRRNIVYCSLPEAKLVKLSRFTDQSLAESDRNLFWHAGQPVGIHPIGPLSEWRKKGFDTHSLVGEPMFTDPEHDDYSLRPESPACELGFNAIEMRGIGPRATGEKSRGKSNR